MLNQFDHVRVIANGITGIILDLLDGDNYSGYLIEADEDCDVISCSEDEVELIE